MTHLFDISYLITNYGYLGILVIVFLESGIFFPLPGDSLIFTAGLMAPALGWNIIFLVFLVFGAAFLGGLAGYYLGTKIEYFHHYAFFRKTIKKEYIDQAYAFLQKHGLSAMVLSRFVPVVRTFLPIVAGIVKMNYHDFVNYSLVGSATWSVVFVLGGYFLGKSFPQIQDYLTLIIIIIVIVSILPAVVHWWGRRKKTK